MFAKPFVRAPYNYDTMIASDEAGLRCEDLSLAIQSSKDECDINVIVERFTKTGMLPQRQMPPLGEEFAEIFDFRSAMDLIRSAEVSFNSMDAKVRKRFSNDPAEFVAFCSDPANIAELQAMGLAVRPEDSSNAGVNQNVGVAGTASGGDSGAVPAGAGAGS